MPLLILEGLTGAGKSSTLEYLVSQLAAAGRSLTIFYEEESFGELMDELAEANGQAYPGMLRRLEAILAQLPAQTAEWVILERFHPSYYALLPQWELYQAIDARLAELGARQVLLGYPPELVAARALYRHERDSEGWSEGWLRMHGSEAGAIEVLTSSLNQRREAVARSALPSLQLDTSAQDWPAVAAAIVSWGESQLAG